MQFYGTKLYAELLYLVNYLLQPHQEEDIPRLPDEALKLGRH